SVRRTGVACYELPLWLRGFSSLYLVWHLPLSGSVTSPKKKPAVQIELLASFRLLWEKLKRSERMPKSRGRKPRDNNSKRKRSERKRRSNNNERKRSKRRQNDN